MNDLARQALDACAYHPLLQLDPGPLREFLREPEAIFWVYVFPLVLVVALGVAFRNRPVEVFRSPSRQGGRGEQCAPDARTATRRFRSRCATSRRAGCGCAPAGRTWSIVPSASRRRSVTSTTSIRPRPESVLARNAADDLLQRAAGRRDAVAVAQITRSTSRAAATSISSCPDCWAWA